MEISGINIRRNLGKSNRRIKGEEKKTKMILAYTSNTKWILISEYLENIQKYF